MDCAGFFDEVLGRGRCLCQREINIVQAPMTDRLRRKNFSVCAKAGRCMHA